MRKYVLGAVVLILLAASVAFAFRRSAPVPQPIAYPHKTHIANQMECLTCQANADRSTTAKFQSVADCMVCHENIKADSPEIKKLAAYAARNEEPPWVRVYQFEAEADVYFTHKRHVNDLIYESLHEHVETESIAFFCECGSGHCFEPVWLTGAEYATEAKAHISASPANRYHVVQALMARDWSAAARSLRSWPRRTASGSTTPPPRRSGPRSAVRSCQ